MQEQALIHPTILARLQPNVRTQLTVDRLQTLQPQAQLALQQPINNWEIQQWQFFLRPCPCIWALFVPYCCCLMQARNAQKIDGTDRQLLSGAIAFLQSFLGCCIGCALNRQNVRQKFQIRGSFCEDLLSWIVCPCGSAMQEYNEVNNESWTRKLLEEIDLVELLSFLE